MKSLNHRSSLDAFHELDCKEDQRLQEVLQCVENGCLNLIALKFTAGVLIFAVDPDADTVEVSYEEANAFNDSGLVHAGALAPWSALIGQPFGWGWVTINQQGYQDGVLLSFGGLQPSVLLVAAAASLRIYGIKDMTNGTVPSSDKG
jgi:Family of unknown function (DUF6334)